VGEANNKFCKSERRIFLRRDLERGNHLDGLHEIRFFAQGLFEPFLCREEQWDVENHDVICPSGALEELQSG
jgi:hypothetical protein